MGQEIATHGFILANLAEQNLKKEIPSKNNNGCSMRLTKQLFGSLKPQNSIGYKGEEKG